MKNYQMVTPYSTNGLFSTKSIFAIRMDEMRGGLNRTISALNRLDDCQSS